MVFTLAGGAEASTRSIVVKTDSMPTTFTFNYTKGESVKVNCLTIKTGGGRVRTINIKTYYSGTNTFTGTMVRDFKMRPNRTTKYCVANEYNAGFTFHKPFARIKVVESVPGPFDPSNTENFYF